MNDANTQTIDKYSRAFGALQDVGLCSKPTTIEYVEPITGRVRTFVLQTIRTEDGDSIFIKIMDDDGLIRAHLPPKVAATLSRQRDALTKRGRSIRSKASMKNRMANGWKPTPPPKSTKRRKKRA